MNACNRTFPLVFWLTAAALMTWTACSPASEPVPATTLKQREEGFLLQDAPPTLVGKPADVPAQVSLPTIQSISQEDCPGVDSQLYQITQAPTPQVLAEQFLVEMEEGRLYVLLILADKDLAFLQDYDVRAGSQYGTRVQAFVPVDRLCELANTDRVTAIVRLDRNITQ